MNYHNIDARNIENGDGIRVVLWVSGCSHNCPECYNQQTHDPMSGIEFDEDAEREIFAGLNQDFCAGITLSGGDPLMECNYNTMLDLCKQIKKVYGKKKTIWVYTGYTFEALKDKKILNYIDVLVEGPYVDYYSDKQYHWAGSLNQRVLNIPMTLETGFIVFHEQDQENYRKQKMDEIHAYEASHMD